MSTNYNPGEPVFDQSTGDLVIDPTTGDAVLVEPGAVWSDPVTGTVYQQDDVANAAYYRVNTYVGEVMRDQSIGVDYINVVFGMPVSSELIIAEVSATMLSTPGLSSLTAARLVSFDVGDRSALFLFSARKKDASSLPVAVAVQG